MPNMTNASDPSAPNATETILSLVWNKAEFTLTLSASIWLMVVGIAVAVILIAWRIYAGGFTFKNFEIDQADIGIGDQKFTFKPNMTDKQVAYAIWVELSTRKIGLPIDFDHDVDFRDI